MYPIPNETGVVNHGTFHNIRVNTVAATNLAFEKMSDKIREYTVTFKFSPKGEACKPYVIE